MVYTIADFIILELDITPRRYQEAEDNPLISTMFELLEHNKVIARDYSAALLESEYKMLISGIEIKNGSIVSKRILS